MRLADEIAERRDLDRDWVRAAVGQAVLLRQVPRLMLPPARGKTGTACCAASSMAACISSA